MGTLLPWLVDDIVLFSLFGREMAYRRPPPLDLPMPPHISPYLPISPHHLPTISQVLPAEADTAPLATLRTLAGGARAAALGSEALPPPAPWAALRAMLPRP